MSSDVLVLAIKKMPKTKEKRSTFLHRLVKEYPDLKTDGSVLICNVCCKHVCADKSSNIKQHLDTKRHMDLKERESQKKLQQTFIDTAAVLSAADRHCMDLCETFVAAGIPLYKIRHPKIGEYLQQYTSFHIPSESSLRNKYVKSVYECAVGNIKKAIQNRFLWISIDETTDAMKRYVANVVVGILHAEEEISKQRFLINVEVLEKVNHSTIARLFDNSINKFGINKDNVLIFVTDAAPYMVKASASIRVFYPNITHITCIAHGMHRVCEYIRDYCSNVDLFISKAKTVFLKSPARIQILRETAPNLPLPPEPVTTRWGTWLKAVNYYAKYFDVFLEIFEKLNGTDSSAVRICQPLIKDCEFRNQMIYISTNFGFLSEVICKLETKNLSLEAQVNIIKDTSKKLSDVAGDVGVNVHAKLQSVIFKNKGFAVMKEVSEILSGKNTTAQTKYTSQQIINLKYSPLTSVDVERTFSVYKNMLCSNRQSFLFENLSQQFLIHCNNMLNDSN